MLSLKLEHIHLKRIYLVYLRPLPRRYNERTTKFTEYCKLPRLFAKVPKQG